MWWKDKFFCRPCSLHASTFFFTIPHAILLRPRCWHDEFSEGLFSLIQLLLVHYIPPPCARTAEFCFNIVFLLLAKDVWTIFVCFNFAFIGPPCFAVGNFFRYCRDQFNVYSCGKTSFSRFYTPCCLCGTSQFFALIFEQMQYLYLTIVWKGSAFHNLCSTTFLLASSWT